VLDAAGYDKIVIETVGAGQTEVDIARLAHTVVVVEAPGMGDDIQTIKAGILEIADLLVVNKVDRPGSDRTVKALQAMLHMGPVYRDLGHHGRGLPDRQPQAEEHDIESGWSVPLLETVAIEGRGISAVVDNIQDHKNHLTASGEWLDREKMRSRREINQLLQDRFMSQLQLAVPVDERETIVEEVATRKLDPYSAVEKFFQQLNTEEAAR
jgi:LAO/AO transport system kinase